MKHRYTIKEVRDQYGTFWPSEQILAKSDNEINRIRTQCYQARREGSSPPYVCGYCGKPVWLPATVERSHHFKHFQYPGIEECIYYSGKTAPIDILNARKYNGAKEGSKHIDFKNKILQCLFSNPHIQALELEKVIDLPKADQHDHKREWRKPDINGTFKNVHFAVELQFSSTWLDVIIGRTLFYRKLGYFLLWVFDKFYPEYTHRKVAYSDVFCNNNENAFVFDEECYALSKAKNDLVMTCYYSKYRRVGFEIHDQLERRVICFSELTFDLQKQMLYYFDSLGEKARIEKEIELELRQIEEEKQQALQRYFKDERNKEYDEIIQDVKSSLAVEASSLDDIMRSIKHATKHLLEEESLYPDSKIVADHLLCTWMNNADTSEYTVTIDPFDRSFFIKKINETRDTFIRQERLKKYYEILLSELKADSARKIQASDFCVLPRSKTLFDEFSQSIYFLRRIEIETSIMKPNLQKLTYSQRYVAALSDNTLLFVMLKADLTKHRKELADKIKQINPTLDFSSVKIELEEFLNRKRDSKLKAAAKHLADLENKRNDIQKKYNAYQNQLLEIESCKRAFNERLTH